MCCEHIIKAFDADKACIQSNSLRADESGNKFRIEIPDGSTEQFCCIHVDHKEKKKVGLIAEGSKKKCDYWFRRCLSKNNHSEHNYFVELKGSDLKQAFLQIIETIAQARDKEIAVPKKSITGVIVLGKTKAPKASTRRQSLTNDFESHHGVRLFIEKKEFVLTIKPV